jgi:hypothetical protein
MAELEWMIHLVHFCFGEVWKQKTNGWFSRCITRGVAMNAWVTTHEVWCFCLESGTLSRPLQHFQVLKCAHRFPSKVELEYVFVTRASIRRCGLDSPMRLQDFGHVSFTIFQ